MDLKVNWKSPIPVENVELPSIISNLVQSGIKFFLHQRNQIPLTFEQLISREKSLFQPENVLGNGLGQEGQLLEDVYDPKERIKLAIAQRKRHQAQLKRRRKVEKMSKKENAIVSEITDSLKILNSQLLESSQHIVAVGLFFGTSVESAKEIVFFNFSKMLRDSLQFKDGLELAKSGHENVKDFNTNLTRSFYKSIIMTEDFCDFTAKNLPSTRSHICVLSAKKLEQVVEDDQMIRLLDSPHVFMDHLSFNSSDIDDGCYSMNISQESTDDLNNSSSENIFIRPKNKKKKVFKITIDIPTTNKNTHEEGQHFNSRNIHGISFESLFCYQIPLRLKGITVCKNNRI